MLLRCAGTFTVSSNGVAGLVEMAPYPSICVSRVCAPRKGRGERTGSESFFSPRDAFFATDGGRRHGIVPTVGRGAGRTIGARAEGARATGAVRCRPACAPVVDVPLGFLLPRARTQATPRRRGRRRSEDGRGPSWGRLICARRSRGAASGLPRFWNPARGERGCARTARRTSTTSLAFWLGEASDARVNVDRGPVTWAIHTVREPNQPMTRQLGSHSKSERSTISLDEISFRDLSARERRVQDFLCFPERTVFSWVFPPVRVHLSNLRNRRSQKRIMSFDWLDPTGFDQPTYDTYLERLRFALLGRTRNAKSPRPCDQSIARGAAREHGSDYSPGMGPRESGGSRDAPPRVALRRRRAVPVPLAPAGRERGAEAAEAR